MNIMEFNYRSKTERNLENPQMFVKVTNVSHQGISLPQINENTYPHRDVYPNIHSIYSRERENFIIN